MYCYTLYIFKLETCLTIKCEKLTCSKSCSDCCLGTGADGKRLRFTGDLIGGDFCRLSVCRLSGRDF